MENKNQVFYEVNVEEKARVAWPDGEPIHLSEPVKENKEPEELAGVNQSAMADALKEIISTEEENSWPAPENAAAEEIIAEEAPEAAEDNNGLLFQLADKIREEEKSSAAEREKSFQTEIMDDKLKESREVVVISKQKLAFVQKLINNIKENSRRLEELLNGNLSEDEGAAGIEQFAAPAEDGEGEINEAGEKVLEGVFNGQHMIGPDGKQYSIPPNYASKSKLVEGDILKLTIGANGKFIYKQIGPIERERVIGSLCLNNNGEYFVEQGDKRWRILTASVTYFKGRPDDEAVILVPKYGESNWAAVENIINKL
ncbi:hypothetical protein COU00_02365 [Candidatus Falkowbacteria bacterium CG10_big_fil_rev_8_21_14_0_10_43_11]|uniref:50S ribosomal protein L7/L12 n=1 Tax=Candidatus Falkowbacteria bacterium CG10_big_fil_rev_8_21_14_0_10_43_11 TaxID=1974568 RepID=A0A2M6WM09_9BACT|nr:MAG: hypothetical protein COU00_02365 [Candidatus Falkowbacteria bacterium CG10_big_fil_rev_8_21_14_0_10_43_11]